MEHASVSVKPPIYLVGCDNKEDIRVFSGITYHLGLAGVEGELFTAMVNLYPRGIRAWPTYARAGWWKRGVGLRGRQGFRYTEGFVDGVWKLGLPALRGSAVISNFQLFGSYFVNHHKDFGVTPYVYIDGTLEEYFGDYRAFDTANIDEETILNAVAAEREGYAVCPKVVVMSRRTAAHIVRRYDVPQSKIHIIPPGANIPERALETLDRRPEAHGRSDKRTFVVGFTGLAPERKGLPTIAGAVMLLRRSGYDIQLHIIGKCSPEVAQQDGVTYHGLIDKRVDTSRFVEILRSFDVGCMLSRAELTGIALLEFLRLGVPIIATDIGGIPDIVELGAGQLVSPEISPSDLAECFARLMDRRDRLAELRDQAWRSRSNASWRRVVESLKGVIDSP